MDVNEYKITSFISFFKSDHGIEKLFVIDLSIIVFITLFYDFLDIFTCCYVIHGKYVSYLTCWYSSAFVLIELFENEFKVHLGLEKGGLEATG